MCRSHRLATGIQNPTVDSLTTYTPPALSQVLIGGRSELIHTNSERFVFEIPSWECQLFVVISAVLLVEDSQLSQTHQSSSVFLGAKQ